VQTLDPAGIRQAAIEPALTVEGETGAPGRSRCRLRVIRVDSVDPSELDRLVDQGAVLEGGPYPVVAAAH
jgi:hypothetical protein